MSQIIHSVCLPEVSLAKVLIRRKYDEFEKNNPVWSANLRQKAKDVVSGREFDISPYLWGISLDYYNSCVTQLLMYKN